MNHITMCGISYDILQATTPDEYRASGKTHLAEAMDVLGIKRFLVLRKLTGSQFECFYDYGDGKHYQQIAQTSLARHNTTEPMLLYSKPRLRATVEDWPYGRQQTTATFTVEQHPKRGERVIRTTINPKSEQQNAPRKTTYATKMRLVDGSNGKIYLAKLSLGFIMIYMSNMSQYVEPYFPEHPLWEDMIALFN